MSIEIDASREVGGEEAAAQAPAGGWDELLAGQEAGQECAGLCETEVRVPAEQRDEVKRTDDVGALNLIRKASQSVSKCYNQYLSRKEAAAKAQNTWQAAVISLIEVIDRVTRPLPLSDAMQPPTKASDPVEHPAPEASQAPPPVGTLPPEAVGQTTVRLRVTVSDDQVTYGTAGKLVTAYRGEDGKIFLAQYDEPLPPAKAGRWRYADLDTSEWEEAALPTSPAAWRALTIDHIALFPTSLLKKLRNENLGTIGALEDHRAAVSLGKAKWPKGIGPAKISKIEDALIRWLPAGPDTGTPPQAM